MGKDIIWLKPVFKQMIWGGSRMREAFGYSIPGDNTGECWAISAHEKGDSSICGGPFDGMKLSTLWRDHRDIFGNAGQAGDVFPLLIKIIDAQKDLSIQVHPDDAYAAQHENGALGKTECWYILDCDSDASIIVGHNARDKAELEDMIHSGRWKEFLREIPIKKGDFFQINPGTVHAIKGGTLILETQQNSDITYRVYDYDRLQDGKPRQLHVQQSLDVIRVPFTEASGDDRGLPLTGGSNESLVSCAYYQVWKLTCDGRESYQQDKKYLLCSVIEGEGRINGEKVSKGMHFILPYGFGEFTLEGKLEIICSCGE